MTQSTWHDEKLIHAAIIMDGNGRWATAKGMPRIAGHRAGVEAARRVIEVAPDLGIRALTLYAFSADNWNRPAPEVRGLMALVEHFVRREVERCERQGVEVLAVGRRDRLPRSVRAAIEEAESRTRRGAKLTLRVALDYSSRDALVQAAALAGPDCASREAFAYALAAVYGTPGRRLPEVDLLIRTAGEQRLSDFLLWESAYAELHFTPTLWPDFGEEDLRAAMSVYRQRNRTFGGLDEGRHALPALPAAPNGSQRRLA